MGNPAQMRSGEMLREKLRNAAQLGPQPSTPPIMGGLPPEGLVGGLLAKPDIATAPMPMPRPAPGPVSSIAPGLVSNLVNTGITGRRNVELPTPISYTPTPAPNRTAPIADAASGYGQSMNRVNIGGQNRPTRTKQKRNKAFAMPQQNKGMLF